MTNQEEQPASPEAQAEPAEAVAAQDPEEQSPARRRLPGRVRNLAPRFHLDRRPVRGATVAAALLVIVALAWAAQVPALGLGASTEHTPSLSGPPTIAAAVPSASPVPPPRPTTSAATFVATASPHIPEQTPASAVLKPRPGQVFNYGDPARQEVYITIDDCSNWANIQKDLETAHQNDVQLTLFPAGKYIDSQAADAGPALQKAVSYGDEIDNHTYTHTFIEPGTTGWKGDLDAQLATVRTALKDPGYREWFVRPPYGSGLSNTDFVTAAWDD